MQYKALLTSSVLLLTGCDPSQPTPVQQAPAAQVEVGGPQGGVHVHDPAGGTQVDVDRSGVHVEAPNTKVNVP